MLGTPKASYTLLQVTKVETNKKMAYDENLSAKNGQSAAKLRRLFKMYLITKEQYYNNLKERFPTENFIVLDPFTSATGPVNI